MPQLARSILDPTPCSVVAYCPPLNYPRVHPLAHHRLARSPPSCRHPHMLPFSHRRSSTSVWSKRYSPRTTFAAASPSPGEASRTATCHAVQRGARVGACRQLSSRRSPPSARSTGGRRVASSVMPRSSRRRKTVSTPAHARGVLLLAGAGARRARTLALQQVCLGRPRCDRGRVLLSAQ